MPTRCEALAEESPGPTVVGVGKRPAVIRTPRTSNDAGGNSDHSGYGSAESLRLPVPSYSESK